MNCVGEETGFVLIASDNLAELSGLQNVASGVYIEDAAVTLVSLTRKDTAEVVATNIAMPHVTGTSGEDVMYRGTLPYTTTLLRNKWYRAVVTADAGAGLFKTWEFDVQAVYAGTGGPT